MYLSCTMNFFSYASLDKGINIIMSYVFTADVSEELFLTFLQDRQYASKKYLLVRTTFSYVEHCNNLRRTTQAENIRNPLLNAPSTLFLYKNICPCIFSIGASPCRIYFLYSYLPSASCRVEISLLISLVNFMIWSLESSTSTDCV